MSNKKNNELPFEGLNIKHNVTADLQKVGNFRKGNEGEKKGNLCTKH